MIPWKVGKQLRFRIAAHLYECAFFCLETAEHVQGPRRRVIQRLVRAELDERSGEMSVDVGRFDDPSAGPIRGARDLPHQGAFSKRPKMTTSWPGWTLAPTETVSSARRSIRVCRSTLR